MTTAPIRSLLAVTAVVVTGLLLAACGSNNDKGPTPAQVKDAAGQATQALSTAPATTTTTPATTTEATTTTTQQASADGKAVFTANCSSCHTLSAAGASGQVGPNLDDLKPSESTVSNQVNKGGAGMPAFAGQLSPAEIKAVAAYVASNAGA